LNGVFIIVDGVDGAGKGHAMMRLQEFIMGRSKKYDGLLLTREPTNGTVGKKIRERLAAEKDATAHAREFLDLYVADRREHLENHILPALVKGYVVLCDRFKYSTVAFQHAQGVPVAEIVKAHEGLKSPDLALILDVPFDVARGRMDGRAKDKFDDADSGFHDKVRETYLEMPKIFPNEKIVIIDASKPKEEVAKALFEAVENSGVLPY